MTQEKSYVSFGFSGHFDPAEVTETIGLPPTHAHNAGDVIRGRTRKASSWESRGDEIVGYIDVYEQSKRIIEKLHPNERRIAEAVQRFELTPVLSVVLNIMTEGDVPTPAIGFDEKVVAFLARVGASIDADTYLIS